MTPANRPLRGHRTIVHATLALTLATMIAACGATRTITRTVLQTSTITRTITRTLTVAISPRPRPHPVTRAAAIPCATATGLVGIDHCTVAGETVALAHGTKPLRLRTLTAQIIGLRTATSLADPGVASATANGVYIVITLKIVNRSQIPQSFDGVGGNATLLALNGSTYSESFDAENGPDQQSFLSETPTIQPGESATGDVIFDVPTSRARSVDVGVLIVGDFASDLSSSLAGAGLITLNDALNDAANPG